MFFIKGLYKIKGMFQVLNRFLEVVRYKIAFLLNKVYELLIKGLRIEDFFNFIFNLFTNDNKR